MAYKKIEEYDQDVTESLMKNYQEILHLIGEDTNREGLQKTPKRVAKFIQFAMQGYQKDPVEILTSAKVHEPVSEMVIVKNI